MKINYESYIKGFLVTMGTLLGGALIGVFDLGQLDLLTALIGIFIVTFIIGTVIFTGIKK